MSQDNSTTSKPYLAIYLLFQKEGKVALLLRENTGWMNGYYGLPSGRVEHGETLTQAAMRECQEEVAIKLKPAQLQSVLTVHLKAEDDTEWIAHGFRVKKWQGEPQNAEPHVHKELAWFDPEKLPDNVAPSHRFVLERMLKGTQYAEHGW